MILKIDKLSLKFKNTDLLLDQVSFGIKKNEVFALCGESGSGKTLTAMSIMRLLDKALYTNGAIYWQGDNLFDLKEKEMSKKIRGQEISYIFQEPHLALNPTKTIGHQISEVFKIHNVAKKDINKIFKSVGFSDANLDAYPHQLSGGQKQRVLIAMAVALTPKLIIADEPTTALDRHLQNHIINLISKLKKKSSILLISHDFSVVKKLADRIGIMKKGKIIEINDTEKILKNPKHAYTKTLIKSNPPGSPVKITKKTKTILEIKNVNKSFYDSKFLWGKEKQILKNINFKIEKGKTLGVVGESGSGKTTIAKLIVKLENLNSGEIIYNNETISNLSLSQFKKFRKKIQYIFQDPYASLSPTMTIDQILSEGLKIHYPKKTKEDLYDILDQVGLEKNILSRYPHEFSGGQRQRICIARALVLNPELLILDEPTSSLDRTVQKNFLLLLKKLQKEKALTYIFISHDLKVVESICHNVVVLKDGVIVESGDTKKVFKNPKHAYTKKLVKNMF